MAELIRHSVTVPLSAADAFTFFATQLVRWWPREYTWSQDVLQAIGIEPRVGGMCYELGPDGFHCDWGRVRAWDPPQRLVLAWQISPRREPEPNPDRASTVEVRFEEVAPDRTAVTLTHGDFERHGDGADAYREAMGSSMGWPYILDRFTESIEKR